MTDNEIIKALECCRDGDCKNCTFDECTTGLLDQGIALSLILRQKAEIERLNKEVDNINHDYILLCSDVAENRAEAIKEFAEIVVRDYPEMEFYLHNLVKEMVGEDK